MACFTVGGNVDPLAKSGPPPMHLACSSRARAPDMSGRSEPAAALRRPRSIRGGFQFILVAEIERERGGCGSWEVPL